MQIGYVGRHLVIDLTDFQLLMLQIAVEEGAHFLAERAVFAQRLKAKNAKTAAGTAKAAQKINCELKKAMSVLLLNKIKVKPEAQAKKPAHVFPNKKVKP